MKQAKTGDTVRIHYTGRLTDNTQFDSSAGEDPLEFQIGGGQLIPGLEREIVGMQVGAKKTVNVASDDAYGPHRAEAVQQVERSLVPPDLDLVVGEQLGATTDDGHTLELTIVEVTDETVTLDANHPLAGQDLVFDVELVEIL